MQTNENFFNESSPLTVLWKTLDKSQKWVLSREMIHDMQISERTVENWTIKGSRPGNFSQRRDVARLVKDYFKLKLPVTTLVDTLFQ